MTTPCSSSTPGGSSDLHNSHRAMPAPLGHRLRHVRHRTNRHCRRATRGRTALNRRPAALRRTKPGDSRTVTQGAVRGKDGVAVPLADHSASSTSNRSSAIGRPPPDLRAPRPHPHPGRVDTAGQPALRRTIPTRHDESAPGQDPPNRSYRRHFGNASMPSPAGRCRGGLATTSGSIEAAYLDSINDSGTASSSKTR